MAELTIENIQQMLDEERVKLLEEVKEAAKKRKSRMIGDEVTDYNFFKRRESVS